MRDALWYCRMTSGPGGAFGLWNGSVFSQASKAGRNSTRKRRSKSAAAFALPVAVAASHDQNVLAS